MLAATLVRAGRSPAIQPHPEASPQAGLEGLGYTLRLPRQQIAGQYARREDSRVQGVFEKYFQELKKAYAEKGTEHSGRTALENLLNAVAAEVAPKARVQQEPLRHRDKGAPDFKVSQDGMKEGAQLRLAFEKEMERLKAA